MHVAEAPMALLWCENCSFNSCIKLSFAHKIWLQGYACGEYFGLFAFGAVAGSNWVLLSEFVLIMSCCVIDCIILCANISYISGMFCFSFLLNTDIIKNNIIFAPILDVEIQDHVNL